MSFELFKALFSQVVGTQIESNQTSAIPDRAKLGVGQIARMRVHRRGYRMGRDERAVRHLRHIPKAGFIQMRHIRKNPQGFHPADRLLPKWGQSLFAAGGTSIPQLVGPVPR